MWKEPAPCRQHRFCPLAVSRGVHLIFLVFDYHSGGDPLPCENARYITLETAQQVLTAEAHTAYTKGKSALRVRLMGGDPFRRFSELRELCRWAWENLAPLPVEFELLTTFDPAREAAFQWYSEYRDKLLLWLRCSHLSPEAVRFALQTGCGIAYQLELQRAEEAYPELSWLLDNEIPIKVQWDTSSDGLTAAAYQQYERLLKRLREHPKAAALPWVQDTLDLIYADNRLPQDTDQGKCYDTNGWAWSCPALSHLHLHSWSMDQQALEEVAAAQPQWGLGWLCPGQALTTEDAGALLQSFRFLEYSLGIHVLHKMNDKTLDQAMKKLVLEKTTAPKSLERNDDV